MSSSLELRSQSKRVASDPSRQPSPGATSGTDSVSSKSTASTSPSHPSKHNLVTCRIWRNSSYQHQSTWQAILSNRAAQPTRRQPFGNRFFSHSKLKPRLHRLLQEYPATSTIDPQIYLRRLFLQGQHPPQTTLALPPRGRVYNLWLS